MIETPSMVSISEERNSTCIHSNFPGISSLKRPFNSEISNQLAIPGNQIKLGLPILTFENTSLYNRGVENTRCYKGRYYCPVLSDGGGIGAVVAAGAISKASVIPAPNLLRCLDVGRIHNEDFIGLPVPVGIPDHYIAAPVPSDPPRGVCLPPPGMRRIPAVSQSAAVARLQYRRYSSELLPIPTLVYLPFSTSYTVFAHLAVAETPRAGYSTVTVSQRFTRSSKAISLYSSVCSRGWKDTERDTVGTPIALDSTYVSALSCNCSEVGCSWKSVVKSTGMIRVKSYVPGALTTLPGTSTSVPSLPFQ